MIAVLATLPFGCDRAQPPVNGLAGFELGKTMLADVPSQARCYLEPKRDIQRCIFLPATSIAGRSPEVQLDFDGKGPQATVAEIILTIPGCRFDELTSWLGERIGKVSETGDKRAFWQRDQIFVAAEESGPARCYVTAVKPTDTARVASLRGATP